MVRLLCVLVLSLGFLTPPPPCHARIYTNHWAVRIPGGAAVAERIAEKYGYRNMGQIGDLKDHYHFFHSRTIKRSTLSSRGRHSFISMEPKVEWIQQQVVKRRIKRDYKMAMPLSLSSHAHSSQTFLSNIFYNDAKWSSMWYIHCNDDVHNCQSDMNIMGAWKRGYTGKGVVVTILDDGIERNHPDLAQNYDHQASFDVNGNDLDPMPRYDATNENKHGTRCAGEVAASANNSHCIVGIAYNARIGGVRMLDGDVTDMVEAKSLSLQPQHIDIYSASWGPDDDGKTVDGPASLARQAFENGIRMGRKGLGSIFVWASGNGGRSRDHCSCDGYTNSIYTISISSTAESGRKPWYLEECSSTLTTTYSSGENYDRKIITTDLRHRCTDSHTGTSASAPMAAAIIALALEANPLLTWRDVQHIIVKTSRAGHLSAPDWKTNAAGYNVSHLYGFGLMDAEAMVKEAERWKQLPSQHVPPQHVCVESADRQIRTIRPEHVVRSVYKATGCTDNPNHHVIYLEHVVVRITITHPRRGDLSINLTSPSGTKSQLLANRLFDHSMEGFKNWEFMTTHCWGEKAAGDWVLEIYDSPSQLRSQKVPGKLKEWSLVLYGTSVHPYSSLRSMSVETRSTDAVAPTDEVFTEEYNGPCDSECNEHGCEGPGPHHCINCLHYFLKFKNNTRMCVSECPSGFFRDDRKRCKKCSSLCETCMGSRSDQCTTCRPGFHLNEGSHTCVAACGDTFYLDHDSNICRRCPENCKKCTASNFCTECKLGTSLLGNKCQMTCAAGSYYNGHRRTCEPCHRACATCAGTGIEACTKCADGYLLEDWRCVATCSNGYYLSEQAANGGQVQKSCKKCDHSCYECLGPGERNCSSCVSGYNLEVGACVVSTICKDGQYMGGHGKCRLCDATCLECTGPEREDCTSCTPTRLFDEGACVIRCQRGRYAMAGECHRCHPTCHECTDEGPDNCTSCDTDMFDVPRYLFGGQCRDVCPEAFFHSVYKRCEPCASDCVACASASRCLSCSPGHKLREEQCFPLECRTVELAEAEACLPCDDGCKQCAHKDAEHPEKGTNCLKCEDDFYQMFSDCYKSCPDGTIGVPESMTCAPCEDRRCTICDESQCYWCQPGFYLFDGRCVEECHGGFFVDEEGQECEACHRACETCGGPRFDDCDSCRDELVLKDGECVKGTQLGACPSGRFRNRHGDCELCHSSCEACFDARRHDCVACHQGAFLTSDQTCVSRCPASTFANVTSGRCDSCADGCVACHGADACQRCRAGLYMQHAACVLQCDRGFPEGGTCRPCAVECASCNANASFCLSCEPDRFLLEHRCVRDCPPGYYSKDVQCLRCPPDCIHCNQDGLCLKCADYFFLHIDKCVDGCPAGFFPSEQQHECVRCHADCASCDGPDRDDCNACRNPKALRYNGECLPQCPSNTYYEKADGECRDCDRTCLTCSGHEPSSCLSCESERRRDASGRCVWYSQCSERSYADGGGECRLCHASCRRCSGGPGPDRCLACDPPRFLLNSTCVLQCPAGYYGDDKEARTCERCHFSCASCAGRHSVQCHACRRGFFRQGSSCVQTCSESHFGNSSSMACERCDPACGRCRGPADTDCLSCRDGFVYVRRRGRCLKNCPSGYYHHIWTHTCLKCHPTCKTCTGAGATSCESCYHGYRLIGSSICESQCLIGSYLASQERASDGDAPDCRPCDRSCLGCRGAGAWNCTDCPASQILSDGGRCLSCCHDRTLPADRPVGWQCCDCKASLDECVLDVNFVLRDINDLEREGGGGVKLATTICVLLVLSLGAGIFVFLQARSKSLATAAPANPKTKSGGFKKLDNNEGEGGAACQAGASSSGEYSDRLVGTDDDDDDDEDDIVYMGQDGTVYKKFKYGFLADQDDDIELEYDDESYTYR
ncbi:proprotein convertase subtilisin/kexin type 5b isoform X1 [Phyllopteryx taeniolatus]|uniref:proprotein convertase subtilisin/kexin type 5b isoform X1 n=1 Tax=Phyllopteryx taeniolatus TaxID=161469 RepID=UPI002AD1FC13|nr:proprotein convertase subtilisin/kexin type 5b isoform X1 [Phyllopteryx taeniolatus]